MLVQPVGLSMIRMPSGIVYASLAPNSARLRRSSVSPQGGTLPQAEFTSAEDLKIRGAPPRSSTAWGGTRPCSSSLSACR